MALKVTDLKIDAKSLGEVFLLADIVPAYEYKDGEKTDKLIGYTYQVVLPSHKMEKVGIKVLNKPCLIDIEKEEIPIGTNVKFLGLDVGTYYSKANGISLTIKADEVRFDK